VLSAQDDREWQATVLSQSLKGEGPVAGAEKKKLNLEEEHKVQWGNSFELCHLSLSQAEFLICNSDCVRNHCHHLCLLLMRNCMLQLFTSI
jgi:hypothetical protein